MKWNIKLENIKDHVKSVLSISSAPNKGGPTDITIAQILHLSNIYKLKRTLVYIHLQLRTRKVLDIQFVYVLFYKYSSWKCKQTICYITDLTWSLNEISKQY
jgi:hypothetical protein